MEAHEWETIVEEVEGLWGRSAKWSKADHAFRFARSVPIGAARTALELIFVRGAATAPSPSEVIATARTLTDEPDSREIARYCEVNRHTFGIVEESNGIRIGICGRCRSRVEVAAHLLPTAGEIEDGIYTGRPDPVFDERVAP